MNKVLKTKRLAFKMCLATALPSSLAMAQEAAVAPPANAGQAPAPKAAPVDIAMESGQFEEERQVQGANCSVRVHHPDAAAAKAAIPRALAEIARMLNQFGHNGRTAEVHSINVNAGADEVMVGPEAHALLQRALDLCRRTSGAYDPSIGSYDYLWDFKHKPFVRPLPQELAAKRAAATCKNIVVKPTGAVRLLEPGLRVTLTGVATGVALEKAAQILREAGVQNFRIRIGDDFYVQGRMGTRHWYAGLPNSRQPGDALGQLYLSSHAAVTRSDSDRYVIKQGQRYHDVIDPRSGSPAQGVVQVTIIAPDAVLADAYANAVFALGPKAGMALIAKENGVEGVIVDSNGRIHASKGLGDVARVPERIELATPPAQSAQKF